MDTPSALPQAAQAKMDALRAQTTPPTPPTPPTPSANDPPTPPADNIGERVTLTREEYNDLKAGTEATRAARAREEAAQLRLEEVTQRLTELEGTNKSVPSPRTPSTPPTPPAAAIDTSGITFTDEETTNYGETRAYIEKVARLEVAKTINELLPGIQQQIKEAKESVEQVSSSVTTQAQQTFRQELLKAVPNLQELIRHKNWEDFLDKTEEFTGQTFEALLSYNLKNHNVESLAKIYKKFEEQYIKPIAGNGEFAGAAPDGGATQLPPDPNAPKPKLKMSDRRKASDDYKFKRNDMTWEKLQVIQKEFDKAIEAGNIEYD
jgi:hypothetical protein